MLCRRGVVYSLGFAGSLEGSRSVGIGGASLRGFPSRVQGSGRFPASSRPPTTPGCTWIRQPQAPTFLGRA